MAEQLSLQGLNDTLKSSLMMTDGQLQGHLTDVSQRVEDLQYAPERQKEAGLLLGRVRFELTARAVDAMVELSAQERYKYIAAILGNAATEGFEIDIEQFETVPSR